MVLLTEVLEYQVVVVVEVVVHSLVMGKVMRVVLQPNLVLQVEDLEIVEETVESETLFLVVVDTQVVPVEEERVVKVFHPLVAVQIKVAEVVTEFRLESTEL